MPVSTRADIMTKLAQGKGALSFTKSPAGVNVTAAAAASGYFSAQLRGNELTSTLPGTIDGWPLAPSLPDTIGLVSAGALQTNGSGGQFLCWIYKFGTLNLAATGDQFTHDAATFPILRPEFGTSGPLLLIPLVQITTATATTPPVFRLRTAGGAAGYVDQDGNSVIGTKTMTMPAAATVAGSTYIFRLEEEDSAVRDITNIEVTTAGTTGAATVWGMEILTSQHVLGVFEVLGHDRLFGGLGHSDLTPGVATSGTATAYLTTVTLISGTGASTGTFWGVSNA